MRPFYCPLCGVEAQVVEVTDPKTPSIRKHLALPNDGRVRVHLECHNPETSCPILEAMIEIPADELWRERHMAKNEPSAGSGIRLADKDDTKGTLTPIAAYRYGAQLGRDVRNGRRSLRSAQLRIALRVRNLEKAKKHKERMLQALAEELVP